MAAIQNASDHSDLLMRAIRSEVEKEVARVIEKEIEASQARIAEAYRKTLAQVVMRVMSHYEVSRMGETVTIRVQQPS